MLTSLKLVWYEARLGHLSALPTQLPHLTRLKRLELSMTPADVVSALSALTALTALRIASVGEVLHMQDLGLPRSVAWLPLYNHMCLTHDIATQHMTASVCCCQCRCSEVSPLECIVLFLVEMYCHCVTVCMLLPSAGTVRYVPCQAFNS